MSNAKRVPCTACGRLIHDQEIVYSSTFPEHLLTRAGKPRRATVLDAERRWCSPECARKTYAGA